MNQSYRVQILIAIIAVVASLSGAIGGAWVTGNYVIKSTKEQIDKDLRILSAKNAQENSAIIRIKAESFLVEAHNLITYFEKNPRFEVKEAKDRIYKVESKAYALLAYVGPQLGAKSIGVTLALRSAVEASGPDVKKELDKVIAATGEWYKEYHNEISKYEHHSMPEKIKFDLFGPIIGGLFAK